MRGSSRSKVGRKIRPARREKKLEVTTQEAKLNT